MSKTKSKTLSEREIEVVWGLMEKKDFIQIGKELFISHFTVETHKKNVFRKMKFSTMADVYYYCWKNNLLKPADCNCAAAPHEWLILEA